MKSFNIWNRSSASLLALLMLLLHAGLAQTQTYQNNP